MRVNPILTIKKNNIKLLITKFLNKFIVYSVILSQVLVPTVQAGTFCFEVEKINGSDASNKLSLKIWEHNYVSIQAPLKNEIIYDLSNNSIETSTINSDFHEKHSLFKYNERIGINYHFGNESLNFLVDNTGNITINSLDTDRNSVFFKTYNSITTDYIQKDFETKFDVYGLCLEAGNNIYNNTQIHSKQKIEISATKFINNSLINSDLLFNVNVEKFKNTLNSSISSNHELTLKAKKINNAGLIHAEEGGTLELSGTNLGYIQCKNNDLNIVLNATLKNLSEGHILSENGSIIFVKKDISSFSILENHGTIGSKNRIALNQVGEMDQLVYLNQLVNHGSILSEKITGYVNQLHNHGNIYASSLLEFTTYIRLFNYKDANLTSGRSMTLNSLVENEFSNAGNITADEYMALTGSGKNSGVIQCDGKSINLILNGNFKSFENAKICSKEGMIDFANISGEKQYSLENHGDIETRGKIQLQNLHNLINHGSINSCEITGCLNEVENYKTVKTNNFLDLVINTTFDNKVGAILSSSGKLKINSKGTTTNAGLIHAEKGGTLELSGTNSGYIQCKNNDLNIVLNATLKNLSEGHILSENGSIIFVKKDISSFSILENHGTIGSKNRIALNQVGEMDQLVYLNQLINHGSIMCEQITGFVNQLHNYGKLQASSLLEFTTYIRLFNYKDANLTSGRSMTLNSLVENEFSNAGNITADEYMALTGSGKNSGVIQCDGKSINLILNGNFKSFENAKICSKEGMIDFANISGEKQYSLENHGDIETRGKIQLQNLHNLINHGSINSCEITGCLNEVENYKTVKTNNFLDLVINTTFDNKVGAILSSSGKLKINSKGTTTNAGLIHAEEGGTLELSGTNSGYIQCKNNDLNIVLNATLKNLSEGHILSENGSIIFAKKDYDSFSILENHGAIGSKNRIALIQGEHLNQLVFLNQLINHGSIMCEQITGFVNQLHNYGKLQASSLLEFTTYIRLFNYKDANLTSGRSMTLNSLVENEFSNAGNISADEYMALTGSGKNSGVIKSNTHNINIIQNGTFINHEQSHIQTQNGQVTFTKRTPDTFCILENNGSIVAKNSLVVNHLNQLINKGSMNSEIICCFNDLIDNKGTITASNSLDLTIQSIYKNHKEGEMSSSGNLNIKSEGQFTNDGLIHGENSASLKASGENAGTIQCQKDKLTLSVFGTFKNLATGKISSGANSISILEIINHPRATIENLGMIAANINIDLNNTYQLLNKGTLSAKHVTGSLNQLDNYHKLGATENLNITILERLNNHLGAELGSDINLMLNGSDKITNDGLIIANSGSADINCAGVLTNNGTIQGQNSVAIDTKSDFSTGLGKIISIAGTIDIKTPGNFNYAGAKDCLWSALGTNINVGASTCFGGNILSQGPFTLISRLGISKDGNINTAGPITLTSLDGMLADSGETISGDTLTLSAFVMFLNGITQGTGKVTLSAACRDTNPVNHALTLDGTIKSLQDDIDLQSLRILNRADQTAKNKINIPWSEAFDHIGGCLTADDFAFAGLNLALKSKTNFEKKLTATIYGSLDYDSPESIHDKTISTLSAKESVTLTVADATFNKRIVTPAHLHVSLLPQAGNLSIQCDILAEKGIDFEADTRNILCGEEGAKAPSIQTLGSMTLTGNSLDIINAGLAAKGKIRVTVPGNFTLGRTKFLNENPWIYFQGNGSYLAGGDTLDIITKSIFLDSGTLTSKLDATLISPELLRNLGGKMEFGGHCRLVTSNFTQRLCGMTLSDYKNHGGTEENYVPNCIARTQKPIFHVGENLNFEGLTSGENFAGDIYAGGSISPNVATIIHSDFQGAPVEIPCVLLTKPQVKAAKYLFKHGVYNASLDEIKLISKSYNLSHSRKTIKQDRLRNGHPNNQQNVSDYTYYFPEDPYIMTLTVLGLTYPRPSEIKLYLKENSHYLSSLPHKDARRAQSPKNKHAQFSNKYKQFQNTLIQKMHDNRAYRAAMIVRHTLSAGRTISLEKYDDILNIVGSIQAPQILANFDHMVVGQSLPAGAQQRTSFALVQNLLDFVRPSQMHNFVLDNPIALIIPPLVLWEDCDDLPIAIIIGENGFQQNGENIPRLYHPVFEVEAYQEALKNQLRRGYLDEKHIKPREMYRAALYGATNIYNAINKIPFNGVKQLQLENGDPSNALQLMGSKMDPLLAKSIFASFDVPILVYSTIMHECGKMVLIPHVFWPESWRKKTEKERGLHGGLYALEGKYKGERQDVYGEIHSTNHGLYNVKQIKLHGEVEHKAPPIGSRAPTPQKLILHPVNKPSLNLTLFTGLYEEKALVNGDVNDEYKVGIKQHKGDLFPGAYQQVNCGKISGGFHEFNDFNAFENYLGSLETGNTLFDGENLKNLGRLILSGLGRLDAKHITNERLQRVYQQLVTIRKKQKRYGGLSRSSSTKRYNIAQRESLPITLSGMFHAAGWFSEEPDPEQNQVTENEDLQSETEYPTLSNKENILDTIKGPVYNGTIKLQEWIKNDSTLFVPFIEMDDKIFALYDPETRNRETSVSILNQAKVTFIDEIEGRTVSFNGIDHHVTWGDRQYPLARIVEINFPNNQTPTEIENTGAPISEKKKKSVSFKDSVRTARYDANDHPSAPAILAEGPLLTNPPHKTIYTRLEWEKREKKLFARDIASAKTNILSFKNKGGNVTAGKEGFDLNVRKLIESTPNIDRSLQKYHSKKSTALNKVKVSGAVAVTQVVRPGWVSEAATKLNCEDKVSHTATDFSAQGDIEMESKEDFLSPAHKWVQELPPTVRKKKGMITEKKGKQELASATTYVSHNGGNIAVGSSDKRYLADAASSKGHQVRFYGKSVENKAIILKGETKAKSSGREKTKLVNRKTKETHESALQAVIESTDKVIKFMNERGEEEERVVKGSTTFDATNGSSRLEAPIIIGNLTNKCNGEGNSATITSVSIKNTRKVEESSIGLKYTGQAAVEALCDGKKAKDFLDSLASESSIYTHGKSLLHSTNAQDAVASGLQLGVAGFNALDALANAKNWQEYALGQVSAGIGISKTKSKESSTSNVKPMILTSSEVRNLAPDGHAQMTGVTSNVKQKVIENSGKTADISSPECTYKRETSTVSASVEGGVGAKGVSVSASGSAGGSQAEGRTQDHGTLDMELFIFKAKEGLSASAPVTTDHAILRAKTFNGESKQDFHSGSNWNVSANAGFSSSGIASGGFSASVGEYEQRIVGTNCGIFARQTMDAKFEQMNLKGFALNVDNNAVARPSRDAEGNLEAHPLFEHKKKADGDCALHCLDLTRQEAIQQLKENILIDPFLRELIRKDVNIQINEAELKGGWTIPNVTGTKVYKGWADDLKGAKEKKDEPEMRRIEDLQQAYLLEPEICTAFIKRIYEDEEKWFSYAMLDAVSHINGIHVKIKRLSGTGTFDTVHEFRGGSVEKILLHTVAGIEGGYHLRAGELEETLNHFNLLSMHRGILVSPTITYSHVHNVLKSKSTSIGAQVSPKSAIPGSASFGHDKKNKQSDTLATISSNIHQVTNSDTSGVNQDVEKMTREGKNTGTHVNIHAPAIPLGNVGELWDRGVANAGIVKEKFFGAPVETVAPPQIVRKEEPEDTSITDAEADAIMDDLAERAALMAAREKKPQSKNTIIEGIDTQQWTVNLKNEILKSHNITTENATRLAEQIVTQYKNYRAAGNNHEQALGATQKEMAESCEKMYNQHQAQKSLNANAYEVGLQPAAFPLAAVAMSPALVVEIGAFMTAIAVSCKLTEEAPKSTKSNSPYVNAPPHVMDAAPSGPGADFSDKGFEIHTPEPVIHITPIADALPALGGYEAAPQEFLNGTPEGFTKVDLPDTFILTSMGYEEEQKTKVYIGYTKPHPTGGKGYVGRASGIGDINDPDSIERIMKKRDRNHDMNKKDFLPGKVEAISDTPAPIRGWEDFNINKMGGPQSKGGTSSNKISGISDKNPKKEYYMSEAKKKGLLDD